MDVNSSIKAEFTDALKTLTQKTEGRMHLPIKKNYGTEYMNSAT